LSQKQKIILAIETSCDETAAAVLSVKTSPSPNPSHQGRGKTQFPKIKTLSSVVNSQTKLHSKMGGVVPEAAARAHVQNIRPVIESALKTINYKLETIDYIAVTQGPGLAPSLIVGVEFAKTLSFALKKPIIPVNHMLGHLYSPFAISPSPSGRGVRGEGLFPMISLIVSGGHTMLVLMKNLYNYKVIGETVDDAAGEAFDKIAKLLKLPYPGGPIVSKLAEKGNPQAINFPRPMINTKDYNFSFSGLKTAVLYHLQSLHSTHYTLHTKQNICASFQQAVVDVLTTKTLRAVKEFKAKSISLSGGVSANNSLRNEFMIQSKKLNIKCLLSPLHLTGDNAEMIGIAAILQLQQKIKLKSFIKIQTNTNLELKNV
jgi:N6-L-threonylcarbamoyladenine synthase